MWIVCLARLPREDLCRGHRSGWVGPSWLYSLKNTFSCSMLWLSLTYLLCLGRGPLLCCWLAGEDTTGGHHHPPPPATPARSSCWATPGTTTATRQRDIIPSLKRKSLAQMPTWWGPHQSFIMQWGFSSWHLWLILSDCGQGVGWARTSMEEAQAFKEIFKIHPEHASLIEAISLQKFAMCRLGAEIRQRNKDLSVPNQKKVAERKRSSFTV